jgi:hypothetical protein
MSALALTTITLQRAPPDGPAHGRRHRRALPRPRQAALRVHACFWAYIGFSQYFLIWYSNIPEETAYYVYRKEGGWQYPEHDPRHRALHHPVPDPHQPEVKRKSTIAAVMAAYLLSSRCST